MAGKGKRLTHLTISLGVIALLIAGYAAKDLALEQWYLWELESEDEETQKAAAEKLGKMQSVKAVPKLLQVLRDWEEPKSHKGFNRANLFPNPISGINLFALEMTDEYWQEFWPGRAIAAIGIRGIPHVSEGIQDEGYQFWRTLDGSPFSMENPPRTQALRPNSVMDAGLRKAIQKMGPAAAPYLVEMLSDDNPNTRRVAVLTLGVVAKGSDDPKIISALVNALNDTNFRIRLLCVWAIGEVGPVTENALSALIAAESDKHEWVRVAAAEVLKKIQAE